MEETEESSILRGDERYSFQCVPGRINGSYPRDNTVRLSREVVLHKIGSV